MTFSTACTKDGKDTADDATFVMLDDGKWRIVDGFWWQSLQAA